MHRFATCRAFTYIDAIERTKPRNRFSILAKPGRGDDGAVENRATSAAGAVALTEIMAPHARHDVILVMALPHASPFVRSLSRAADLTQYNKRHFRAFAIRPSTVPLAASRELWMSVAVG